MTALTALNQQLFAQINQVARQPPWLHGLAAGYATYGVVVFGALIAFALWQAGHASAVKLAGAVWAGVGALVAVAINQPIATLDAEPRPYQVDPDTLVLIARSTDWSFPSDHAVMAGACAVGLLIANRRLGVIVSVAGMLLAATRVYVGAHYPFDVLAGLLLGGIVAGVGWLVLRHALTLLVARLRRVPAIEAWCGPPSESTQLTG